MTGQPTTTSQSAARLAGAVRGWLDSLDPGRRQRATFPFDSDERFAWDYRPGQREGLALAEMTPAQRDAAQSVVDVALSDRGAREVRGIIALESTLGAIERESGRGNWLRRDPERYWFAAFGQPGDADPWSWRLGGHHVAIQTTVVGGRIAGSAPSFLGANPATVPGGPLAGQRAIDGEESLARAFLGTLTPAQREIAVVDPIAPPDILSGTGRRADLGGVPSGVRYGDLDGSQRESMDRLIRHYLDRADPDFAAEEWDRVATAGLDALTFAWAGPDEPGRGHYYAIRGPNLLIEYDNTQNGANHIHAVWRDTANDWGEDLLGAHYRVDHQSR